MAELKENLWAQCGAQVQQDAQPENLDASVKV